MNAKLVNNRLYLMMDRGYLLLGIFILFIIGYGIYMFYIDYEYERGVFDPISYKDVKIDIKKFLPARLIEEGYKGFNIILHGTKFYGLAQDEGAFDINKVENKGYKRLFVGRSVDEVKQLIDQSLVHEVVSTTNQ